MEADVSGGVSPTSETTLGTLIEDAHQSPTTTAQAPRVTAIASSFPPDHVWQVPRVKEDFEGLDLCLPRPPSEDVPCAERTQASGGYVHSPRGSQEEGVRKGPLQLLDLPVDVLKDIVKEVTHTNDLIALTLCHSGLQHLAIPHLYSRFDIVWPDSASHGEQRSGVDALTYGLATLVMAEEIFGEAPGQQQRRQDCQQEKRAVEACSGRTDIMTARRRKGNHYAHFTRKFSLGNGPADWVQEYLIAKEGGKMLGTLVALAVARMRSLETFIWDMPTGILRDVWLALSSLGDRDDGVPCRLERLWVRWHDNSSSDFNAPLIPPPPLGNTTMLPSAGLPVSGGNTTHSGPTQSTGVPDRVEHPTFSILSPLKSLSVLDIDELAYLDEMAVLIGKSVGKLRELRVGIARHATTRSWTTVWPGDHSQQVDHEFPTLGTAILGDKRIGGVLGVLTRLVCDVRPTSLRSPNRTDRQALRRSAPLPSGLARHSGTANILPPNNNDEQFQDPEATNESTTDVVTNPQVSVIANPLDRQGGPGRGETTEMVSLDDPLIEISRQVSPEPTSVAPLVIQRHEDVVEPRTSSPTQDESHRSVRMLQLDSLELERVPLSIPILQKGINWTRLTSLTLLNCQHHEQLWKALRRTFAPRPRSPIYPEPRNPLLTPRKVNGKLSSNHEPAPEYVLKLTKVHTNTASLSLMNFLRETLAPNTLEVLFLQDTKNNSSALSIDAIFKGPLKRHRGSLRKLLIDSSEKTIDGQAADSSRWKKWILRRDVLSFICSGKMPRLRELGMAIDYRDWHFFLQRLPSIPHLRSLYLPFLADHVYGANLDPKELALQIVDIVALRPEVEICYMGIATKCFEILESVNPSNKINDTNSNSGSRLVDEADDDDEADSDDDDDDDGDAADIEDDADDGNNDMDDTESEDDDDGGNEDSDDEVEVSAGHARLRLREILFYDDKVAIFKARHGRL